METQKNIRYIIKFTPFVTRINNFVYGLVFVNFGVKYSVRKTETGYKYVECFLWEGRGART